MRCLRLHKCHGWHIIRCVISSRQIDEKISIADFFPPIEESIRGVDSILKMAGDVGVSPPRTRVVTAQTNK